MSGLGRLRLPLLALAVVLIVSVVPSSQALVFTADRNSTVPLAPDPDGVVGLNQATTVRTGGGPQRLVTVTNRFPTDATVVAELTGTSGDGADLEVDGSSADQVSFTLADGGTRDVEVQVRGNAPSTLEYELRVRTGNETLTLARSVPVEKGGGNGGGPPGNGGGGGGGGGPPGGGPPGNSGGGGGPPGGGPPGQN